MAEDWMQYYSGFSENYAPSAQSTINPVVAPTNYGYVAPQPAPTQGLLDYQGSYSALRGWNPDAMAANNSGPALQGGSWGGLLSDAHQYGGMESSPEMQGAPAPDPRAVQDYSAPANPYGDLSGTGGFQDPTGGASNGSLYPGGDYNDSFNAPYTNPYGAMTPAPTNPYGDMSGSRDFSVNPGGDYNDSYNAPYTNPYGDMAAAPTNPYGNLSGVPAMQPPNPYGDLSGVRSPYGDLSGVPAMQAPNPYGTLQGAEQQGWRDEATGNWVNPDMPSMGAEPAYGRAEDLYAGGAGLQAGADTNPTYGDLSGVPAMQPSNLYGDLQPVQPPAQYNDFATRGATMPGQEYGLLNSPESAAPITNTTDYTGGAGLLGGTQTAYAGNFPAGVEYGQAPQADFNQLPQDNSQYDQIGQSFANTQYSSYPLDRSQVPTSVVPKGTALEDLPFPNDAERMRLMRTVNGEDPKNPEAVLHTIRNRLATQQQPNEAPYGNTIGTGVAPLNNGTSVVTRGNQYNAFSPAGYNESNFANNVAGFNESNPNYQTYSDAIDGVWGGNIPDPTGGATNYFTGKVPNWAAQLGAVNTQQIGAHAYMGQTPLYTPPMPPPRPDYLNPSPIPAASTGGDRYGGLLAWDGSEIGRDY